MASISTQATALPEGGQSPLEAAAGIHLARKVSREDERAMRRPLLCVVNFDGFSGWSLALVVAVLALWRVWGYVSWFLFPVLIVAAVGAVAVALLPDRLPGWRRGKSGGGKGGGAGDREAGLGGRLRRAELSDPAFRIRVIDNSDVPGEAARVVAEFRERGATDVSEPEVVPVLVMSESAPALAVRGAVSLAIGAAVDAGINLGFGLGMHVSSLYINLLVVMCTARFAWGFVWPTYARIVPGRLDLLRYGLLGSGSPNVESFDLRAARVLITGTGRILLQRDACDEGTWLSGGQGMGAAVLAAAFSRFSPPPVEEGPYASVVRRSRLTPAAAAPPPPAPDEPREAAGGTRPWLEPVHLAGRIAPEDRRSLRRNIFRGLYLDLVPEWAALGVVALLVGVGALQAAGALTRGEAILVLVYAAVSIAAIWLWHAKDKRYAAAYPYQSDPAHRLRVTGWGNVLPAAEGVIARARATGGREFSEPESFRITHASEPRGEFLFRAAASVTIAALGLALIRITFSPHLPVVGIPWLGLLLLLMVVRTVWGFLWPTVVRVAPGRLEVVRSPLLGLGRPTATALDLRTARVLVDLRYGRVLVQRPGEDEGEWLSGVMGRSVSGGQEMGLAVLAAALSGFEGEQGEDT